MLLEYNEPQEQEEDIETAEREVISYCLTNQVSKETVMNKINQIFENLKNQCFSTDPDLTVPIPRKGNLKNTEVNPIFGAIMQFEEKEKGTISFSRNPRHFAIFIRVLAIIKQTLESGEIVTKRSIYYRDPTLFKSQDSVNSVIDQISRCLEVPRTSLGIIACPKGFVAGPISWSDSTGLTTDSSTHITPIPGLVDNITQIKCKAIAVLIIEKESIFMRLAQSNIVNEVALVTGRGVPDYATRQFVKLLDDTLTIPIVGLFDADAYGIFIAHTYKYGSRAATIDNAGMACTNMKWLGVRPSDIVSVPPEKCAELRERELKILHQLCDSEYIDESWREEMKTLMALGRTAEIEALLCHQGEDLIDTYLPSKFAKRDWI